MTGHDILTAGFTPQPEFALLSMPVRAIDPIDHSLGGNTASELRAEMNLVSLDSARYFNFEKL